MKKLAIVAFIMLFGYSGFPQDYRWQQRADYTLSVSLNVVSHELAGEERLVYTNNSPDTLGIVYFHLYFNAFQPGSMMDVRSRTIVDPDRRIGDRISTLSPSEIGYQRVIDLKQDGRTVNSTTNGTLLEVVLNKPLLPKGKTVFEFKFQTQVPLQVRRSGRDNTENIAYSMTQWYPKIAEYDFQGWHAYQYVAREFHSPWGDYDVRITLDPTFTVAGTGVLQDPDQIGHGYEKAGATVKSSGKNLTWHFVAKNVIDFAWTADPDYTHDRMMVPGGPELHFFYQKNEKTAESWKALQPISVRVFQFLNETFGKYPYSTYSIIQGGDGGMEYPMCTLILGEGKLEGTAGTMAHEVAHSWFQMALASNEALHAWMDEGFTDFASDEALAAITKTSTDHASTYRSYFAAVKNGLLEIPGQHSDQFNTNRGYRTGSYTAGAIFLHQLKYIIGNDQFYTGIKRYYNTWKFRHPEPNDMVRIMEKTSGIQLHWYLRNWIYSTRKIDYEIKNVVSDQDGTRITLARIGDAPMPIDLIVNFKDGHKEMIYIPLNEMLGSKPNEDPSMKRKELKAWAWVDPSYSLVVDANAADIESLEIDPSQRMADINRENNKYVVGEKSAGTIEERR